MRVSGVYACARPRVLNVFWFVCFFQQTIIHLVKEHFCSISSFLFRAYYYTDMEISHSSLVCYHELLTSTRLKKKKVPVNISKQCRVDYDSRRPSGCVIY